VLYSTNVLVHQFIYCLLFYPLSQIKELQQKVSVLQKRLEHTLWHCHVYRHSLRMLPGGYDQYKKSLAEFEDALENGNMPVCSQCERDELIKQIAYLEERVKSPILESKRIEVSFI